MDRVLVVGGAGYVGSHCCKALAEGGLEPIVYDNFSTGHQAFVRWGPSIEGDVRDRERLTAAFNDVKPSAVMHFAALALVGPSVSDPASYYDVNVVGTLRLLEVMRDFSVNALVFSSTCAVYGEPASQLISEDALGQPVNPYGVSKLACEWMMDGFSTAHNVRSVRLRYFNAAGADPGRQIGERHNPETHLIPSVMEATLQRRSKLQIFGTDFPTRDGTAIRDYVHVTDLATAHLSALNYLLDGGETIALNLGTGVGSSVAEIVSQVEAISGAPVPRTNAGRRAGDPAILVADPTKARAVIGWTAKRDLHEIIRDAWEWHRHEAS